MSSGVEMAVVIRCSGVNVPAKIKITIPLTKGNRSVRLDVMTKTTIKSTEFTNEAAAGFRHVVVPCQPVCGFFLWSIS